MTVNSDQRYDVKVAVSKIKAAFEIGKLNQYRPLSASGTGEVKSTCAASWGPAMRR